MELRAWGNTNSVFDMTDENGWCVMPEEGTKYDVSPIFLLRGSPREVARGLLDLRVSGHGMWMDDYPKDKEACPIVVVPWIVPKNYVVWLDNARYIFAGFAGNNQLACSTTVRVLVGVDGWDDYPKDKEACPIVVVPWDRDWET